MNNPPQVGQWYELDSRQIFMVTGFDDRSHTIETQAINGDLDEVDEFTWSILPLALAEPPEDWETIDDADAVHLGNSIDPIDEPLSP
jgi:hypothetical protein